MYLNFKKLWYCIITVTCSLCLWVPLSAEQTPAANNPDKNNISLHISEKPLTTILLEIERKTGCKFAYDVTLIESFPQKITLKIKNKPLGYVLTELTTQTGLQYLADGNAITLYRPTVIEKKIYSNPGTLKGTIIDETGAPLPGANIVVLELKTGLVSNSDGEYSFSLRPGVYTIEISYVSYQTQQINRVVVTEGNTTPLDVVMKPSSQELGEVTVTAEYKKASTEALYAKQKKAITLGNGISAEQIKALPDNNLAQVLKRISGLTVKDNKFVTVRGMSERYNNVQLNGAQLPSTEPNRRNFSFDIIPSNLVDNVVVVKTFSPDMPGEFSGGIVQVNTIDIPNEKFLSMSVGTGINTNSTGLGFRSTKRFASDYFAGGNERTWMNTKFDVQGYCDVFAPGRVKEDAYFAKMAAYNTKIPNTWGLYQFTAQPMQSYSVSGGVPLQMGKRNQIGIVAAITYRHEETTEDYDARFRDKVEITTDNAKRYSFITALGGITNIAWENKNHKIAWRNIYNRRFTHATNEMDVTTESEGTLTYEYYSSVLINTLWQSRLEGEHKLPGNHLKFTWFADQNHLTREQPDDRNSVGMYYSADTNHIVYYDTDTKSPSCGGFMLASLYNETKKNIGGNLEYTLKIAGRDQKIKTGYLGTFRDAKSEMVGFRVLSRNNNFSGLPDYQAYAPSNFETIMYYHFCLTSNITGTSQYQGNQDIQGMYAMADINPFKILRLSGGYRLEKSTLKVRTLTRVESIQKMVWVDSLTTYPNADWLPAITAVLNFTPKLSLRMAYSKTVVRPEFREMSAYKYYDVNERAELMGNGGLVQTYSSNYDCRIEWYPAPGEVISAGIYYKKFIKPVELVTFVKTGAGFDMFYFNLDEATSRGIEFDIRKSLGFIAPGSAFLSKIFLSGNATFMKGDVTYNAQRLLIEAQLGKTKSDTMTNDKRSRQLQGLAPYVLNGGIGYQGKKAGINITYNGTGNIVVLAGTTKNNDEYELGRDVIDLQLSYKLMKGKMDIKFNVSDLLAQPYVRFRNTNPTKQGLNTSDDPKGLGYNTDWDWTLRKANRGTSFSLSVGYKF